MKKVYKVIHNREGHIIEADSQWDAFRRVSEALGGIKFSQTKVVLKDGDRWVDPTFRWLGD